MSSPGVVAHALASAFLAGDWQRAALLERAERVLGQRPSWLLPVVRRVLKRFPAPPHDAFDTLSDVIARAPALRRSLAPGMPRVRLVRWVASEPRMATTRWPVPPLATTGDLAAWLGVDVAELDWFADERGINAKSPRIALQHYSYEWQPKRSGGQRLLEAPKSRLKTLQHRVLRDILERVPTHRAAHGFVTGRSVLTSVALHVDRPLLLRLDLEDFFNSVGSPRIYRIFRSFGYPEPVARALTGICTTATPSHVLRAQPTPSFAEGLDPVALDARARSRRRLRHRHLAQGAPTSPALANLACFRLDSRLSGAARSLSAQYTRYADDLAFSGQLAPNLKRLKALAHIAAAEEGFRINTHKTRVMPQSQRQRLVGLVVNERASVSRAERDRLEAIVTNAVRHGLASQNRDQDPHFLESLRGRVAWVHHVNPAHAAKLQRLLQALQGTSE